MSFVLRGFKWVSVVSPRFSPCTLPQKRIVGVTLVVVVVVVVVIVSVGDAKKTRSVRKTRKRRGRRIHYGDKIDLKDGLAAVRKFHRPLKTWQVSEQRRSRNLARNVRLLKAGQHEGGGSVRHVIYDNRQNSNLGFLK